MSQRINKLLSEHQTLDDDIPDSLFALVRDRTVSLADLDDNTEPPVEEFESGFIGATDEQLWSTLPEYHKEDNKGGKAIHIDPHLLVLLDEISVTNNTIRMLYNPDHGETKDTGRQAWRVDFLYVWGVTPHLQVGREEEIFYDPDNQDENGVLDMQKICDAMGIRFPPYWPKPRNYHSL